MCCVSVIMAALTLASRFADTSSAKDMKVLGTVYPTYLAARGLYGERILKINEHITLNLKKSEVLAHDFVLLSDENGKRSFQNVKPEAFNEHLYSDEKARASLFVYSKNVVEVEGIVSDSLRIKPAHHMGSTEDSRVPHTLYEVTPRNGNPKTEKDWPSPNGTIHPEIHVVADSALAKKFQFDVSKIILYLCVLFNAVNLRYNSITGPRIQLRIVAVTVSRSENYLVTAPHDSNKLLTVATITKFQQHYVNTIEFESCDLLLLFTGRDMVYNNGSVLDSSAEGYAHIGGVCQENKVGMFEDRELGFCSVYVVAHEIGHSLGCVHDGEPALSSIPGHKGSKNCPWKDGYIMTYVEKGDNQYKFSKCCQEDMHNLIRQPKWNCLLHRKPIMAIYRPGLPGKYVAGHKYCKAVFPKKPCVFNEKYGVRDCKIGCICGDKQYAVPALDGAPCDSRKKEHKHCQLGKCVAKKMTN